MGQLGQFTAQSIVCGLSVRLLTLERGEGIVVVTPFLPPALHGRCRALPLSRDNMQRNQPAAVPAARAVVLPCSSLSPIS